VFPQRSVSGWVVGAEEFAGAVCAGAGGEDEITAAAAQSSIALIHRWLTQQPFAVPNFSGGEVT